ncbi:hypothetical protein XELAEV_18044463mg [Xenopus laevis]|uniref:GIY-YIG domain-containing protein n=1 Tax=Xenopus laevis TaxID=8355 RepID=A0A974BYW7_XENLA|nr:hypothetical protein XELAEV_18044463mg [Xenopus laevis]
MCDFNHDLKTVIGDKSIITFRRSKNLKDRLIRSHYCNTPKSTWWSNKTKGCYTCGTCKACPWIKKTTKIECRSDIKEYLIKDLINCKTRGVIYIMSCERGKNYIGKTKREFRRRVLEHLGDVLHKRNTSVANHINESHEGDTSVMKFTGMEHIQSTTRIGDVNRKLLQCEAQWIYWCQSKSPNGLNEGFTFAQFL